ncbi:MAG TPA: class I SAM-dependent methyltransferase [Solirubrobacteraceae bacterium]|nr:class I SAM-dependent methyltransferase [Solirubrobacteraceae bacterium]
MDRRDPRAGAQARARGHPPPRHRLRDRQELLAVPGEGWRVTACDVSPHMLDRAAAKAPPGVKLHLADARELPCYGSFDLVLLLDDVVNYLADGDELVRALATAGANLARGGVLVFDTNLLRAYRTFFAETVIVEDGDTFLAWRGRTPADAAPGVLAEAALDAFVRDADGRWQRHDGGVHQQRYHTEGELRAALAQGVCRDVT